MRNAKVNVSLLLLFILLAGNMVFSQGSLQEPEIGETVILSKLNQGFFVGYEKFSATCQAIGEHAYVYGRCPC